MQSALQSRSKVRAEVNFIEDDIVCPLCESYNIEEGMHRNECFTCGVTWKVIGTSK